MPPVFIMCIKLSHGIFMPIHCDRVDLRKLLGVHDGTPFCMAFRLSKTTRYAE